MKRIVLLIASIFLITFIVPSRVTFASELEIATSVGKMVEEIIDHNANVPDTVKSTLVSNLGLNLNFGER